jgi:hypothetical protein
MALNNKSPNIAYLTNRHVLFPGTSAQATAAEAAARTELGEYLSYQADEAITVSGGNIEVAP